MSFQACSCKYIDTAICLHLAEGKVAVLTYHPPPTRQENKKVKCKTSEDLLKFVNGMLRKLPPIPVWTRTSIGNSEVAISVIRSDTQADCVTLQVYHIGGLVLTDMVFVVIDEDNRLIGTATNYILKGFGSTSYEYYNIPLASNIKVRLMNPSPFEPIRSLPATDPIEAAAL